MVVNRGKTEKRVEREIARLEGRPETEVAPAKKAEQISQDLKQSNVKEIYQSLSTANQLQVINNIVD